VFYQAVYVLYPAVHRHQLFVGSYSKQLSLRLQQVPSYSVLLNTVLATPLLLHKCAHLPRTSNGGTDIG
jgi:hypothetical protein